jgi:putative hydrolase of the HAD superfamily
MHFYRRLKPFKAISFDLDDTLYNNRPIMLAIEKKMVAYFAEQLSSYKLAFHRRYWASFRDEAIQRNPDLSHDVVQVRFESYRLGMLALHMNEDEAAKQAQAGLDHFISLRSDFTVPKASHELLAALSKKYPLVAISNGNVDTKALGIAHYFQYIHHAGFQADMDNLLLKQKPASDMFSLVCQQLAIKPAELLHVGDCGVADIHGALNAGCQTVWLPHYGVGKSLKQLPHIELSNLQALSNLVY